MILYPDGYGTAKLSLEQMKLKHGVKMHPEFARRFFAYMRYKNGAMGVGGGWRSTQPDKPGFAPDGKSFHQNQRFTSGFVGYAAVDLVHVVPGNKHRAPTWAETGDAPTYGLHTFIKVPNEPWHIQCIEMRGWQTWVNAGRPDPKNFTLPGTTSPPPIAPTPEGDDTVLIGYVKHPKHNAVYRQFSNGTKTWVTDGNELAVYNFLSGGPVDVKTMPNDSWMKATGVIVGPIPPGANIYGIPA